MKLPNFKKNEIIIIRVPSSNYKKKWLEIVKKISSNSKFKCYVNVSHNIESLITDFKSKKIPGDKFFFINIMGKNDNSKIKNCVTISSSKGLTGLSLAIKKALGTKSFHMLIFDSISSMTHFHNSELLVRFMHDLFSTIKKRGIVAIFPIHKKMDENIQSDLTMFADQVIEINDD